MANKIDINPSAATLIESWKAAKEAEKAWVEHRRALEEQIYALHPGLIESLQATLNASTALFVSVMLNSDVGNVMKVELKRELVLDQQAAATMVANNPTLSGTLFKCTWAPTASRVVFGAMGGNTELAAELRQAVSFKEQRPYLTQV